MARKRVTPKRVVRRRRTRRSRGPSGPRSMGLDAKALAYRRLLLDPCNAPMVPPTAMGPCTGLLFRQKKIVPLILPTVVAATPGDRDMNFYSTFRPAIGTVDIAIAPAGSSGVQNSGAYGSVNLEATGPLLSARSYRAVAACMKFVPSGSIMSRSGTVAGTYFPDEVGPLGTGTATETEIRTRVGSLFECSYKTISNNAANYEMEVRWIPSEPSDLEFRQKDITYNADTGSIVVSGANIDGEVTSSSFGVNGYLDVTVVYEWMPHYNQGVVPSIEAGSTNTLQQVLGTMGDLSRAAVDSSYARQLLGTAMQTVFRAGTVALGSYITRAARSYITPYGEL